MTATAAQLFGVIAFAVVFIGLNLGFWLWSDRRRHGRLTLAMEDPTPDDDLMDVADAVAERCPTCTSPAPRLHPAVQAEGEVSLCSNPWHEPVAEIRNEAWPAEPTPTLGQERLYDAHDMVPYGTSMVEQGCLQARRDFATDKICPACAAVFGAVRA